MSENAEPRKMPKGGRKGGTQFPQLGLQKAAEYAKKLVSKTHTGPQPATVVMPGVFGAGGSRGAIRASAVKQYGWLGGTLDAYEATEAAKKFVAALPQEQHKYLQEAFLSAKIFRTIYDTFVNDTVSRAKIRQQAAALNVHPESLELATELFVEGAIFAGFGTPVGDEVKISRTDSPTPVPPAQSDDNESEQEESESDKVEEREEFADGGNGTDPAENGDGVEGAGQPEGTGAASKGRPPVRSSPSVKFTVDSSMDPDKLEKHLKLLRKFGVI